MSKPKRKTHPWLGLYVTLKQLADYPRWIRPTPDAHNVDDPLVGYRISPKGERLLRTWQRPGLLTRWGMLQRHPIRRAVR